MKKQILLLLMIMLPLVASADAVEIDGIYYNLINKSKRAEVTKGDKVYSGIIIIPDVVEYEGILFSVVTITEQCFKSSSIESVKIGDNVESIEYGAFEECYSLSQIKFGNKIKSIGESAFRNCWGLKELEIPDNIEIIYSNAFYDCHNLESIILNNGLKRICSRSFANCQEVKKIIIPGSVLTIEKEAFVHCKKLQEVRIEDGVKELQEGCFGLCTELSTVYYPISIVKTCSPFLGCENITSVYIPDLSVCYNGCLEMSESHYNIYVDEEIVTDIIIPENVSSIADNAFSSCISIEKVDIPNSVSYIGYGAFRGCSNLKSINIPQSLTTVYEYTFSGCSKLTKIELPENVNTIYNNAFADCKELVDFYCFMKEIPTTDESAFYGSDINYSTLHVPYGMIEKYKNQKPWSEFGTIIEMPKSIYTLSYILDGELYKTYELEVGDIIIPEPAPAKEGYTFSGWSEIPETMPAHDVAVTGTFTINKYKLTYTVDGEEYKSYDVEYGAAITPEPAPTKEGYTFSGWSEIPETMPAHDVTVTGTFSINQYKLIYTVDGEEYKSYELEYGVNITPEPAPSKEGYTFSGWSEIPETMPAHDVTVTGSFTINQYQVTYIVDGDIFKTEYVEYASEITPPSVLEREGYSFAWNEYPETMPANDITITGQYTINSYKLFYVVDGAEYKSFDVVYNTAITPETDPTKEGYTFSGWSEIPETMPAHDVTVTGSFSINSYKLTYMIDDKVYKETTYEYGATITPEPQPEGDYATFEWTDLPEKMPAHDVVVHASYTTEIIEVLMANQRNIRIYTPNGKKLNKLQKGLNIVVLDDGTVKRVVVK